MDIAVTASLPKRGQLKSKPRVFEIDFLRGFAILLMVLCHLCYDFMTIPSMFTAPASGEPGWVRAVVSFGNKIFPTIVSGDLYSLEFFFSGMFMFLSGVSCSFSKSNPKRSIKLAFVAALMSVMLDGVTILSNGAFTIHIWIGILQSLSISMIVYSLVDHFFPSFWVDYALGIFFTIILGITLYVSNGPVHWKDLTNSIWNMDTLCTNGSCNKYSEWFLCIFKIFFGLARAGDDYFSPFMTLALMFLGATVGKTLYKDRKSLISDKMPKKWATPIIWMGRHSLEIYILHQPALYLAILLMLMPSGYTLSGIR